MAVSPYPHTPTSIPHTPNTPYPITIPHHCTPIFLHPTPPPPLPLLPTSLCPHSPSLNFPTPVPLNPPPSFSRLRSPGAPLRVRAPPPNSVATGSASQIATGSGRAVRWRFPEAAESGGRARGGRFRRGAVPLWWITASGTTSRCRTMRTRRTPTSTPPPSSDGGTRWGAARPQGPALLVGPVAMATATPSPLPWRCPPSPRCPFFPSPPPRRPRGDAASPLLCLPVPTPPKGP